MSEFVLATGAALWFGILTSISPCPLATNIAAISFIGRKVGRPAYVLSTGLLYTLGRALTYVILAIVLVKGLSSMPLVSHWLQKYMNRLLGPILILVAMVLLDLLSLGVSSGTLAQWCHKRAAGFGLAGAMLLGILFALSFCPVSAALFFATLIPLSVKHSSAVLLPTIYGLGTALPVLIFALLIATSADLMGRAFQRVTQFEVWARRITGIVFLAIGIYFTFVYTLGLRA
ncbi:MAG: aromatic aminobenezylarsenical efflux permease ArsG family transporter [Sedimentisphaerales bacterium]|nr:aromatic aminobenezylarsenical efflux permease ArsG family transporter [Sedimentisphaerales bacterium]